MLTGLLADIVVVQPILPIYRELFFSELAMRLGPNFKLLAGISPEETHHDIPPYVIPVKDHYVPGRRFWWQSGVVRRATCAELAVLTLNPRILSNMAVVVIRFLLRRPTLLWGHAWSRSGPSSPTNCIRRFMAFFADGVIAYTESDREELVNFLRCERVWAAPNAIYRRDEIVAGVSKTPTDFVVSSRLTAEKKPGLALAGFSEALSVLPSNVRLVFVGDGPLRPDLEREASRLGIASQVIFCGTVFDVRELASFYDRAIASISAGSVGLSITQSHGFGVPMIYCQDELHGPEIAMAEEGRNAISVESDNPAAIATAMQVLWRNRDEWVARRPAIAAECRENNSIEAMVDGFLTAINETI